MQPIWKDYAVTISNSAESAGAVFSVVDLNASETIFNGRAYPKPGASNIRARINDIVAPRFVRHCTPADGGTDIPYVQARVNNSGGSQLASLYFYPDWSYDLDYLDTAVPSRPATRFVVPGQYVPMTAFGSAASVIVSYGVSTATVTVGARSTQFVDLSGYASLKGVRLGSGGEYCPVRDICARYVLYYINDYGAWDWCVIQGKTEENDGITHYDADKVYDNTTAGARGRDNYTNDLVHRYVFHTGPLDEEESLRMHHLLNSTMVYLHDMQANKVRPLVITNSTAEYKNGGGLYQYAIEAELAQARIRM